MRLRNTHVRVRVYVCVCARVCMCMCTNLRVTRCTLVASIGTFCSDRCSLLSFGLFVDASRKCPSRHVGPAPGVLTEGAQLRCVP